MGNRSTITIRSGTLNRANCSEQCARNAASCTTAPSRGRTNATGTGSPPRAGGHYLHAGHAGLRLDHGLDFLGADEEAAEPHGVADPRLIDEAGIVEASEIAGAKHAVGVDRLFRC